jgi:hypothetical protein
MQQQQQPPAKCISNEFTIACSQQASSADSPVSCLSVVGSEVWPCGPGVSWQGEDGAGQWAQEGPSGGSAVPTKQRVSVRGNIAGPLIGACSQMALSFLLTVIQCSALRQA